MASKVANTVPLNAMPAAGIFADMTVDGPLIGELVVIIDRAKNLPNRKTMGKQDPYCAARLGKEAHKTNTDRRGGQTPKWDGELRFKVHDSPDYHQLKLSVFNDDKKTELIGEAWINITDILGPGGGQIDTWHTLNCRGKYAGEVRMEITFYDQRPRPSKPSAAEKRREAAAQSASGAVEDSHSPGASITAPGSAPRGTRQETPVKRRPLPADPTSGTPPASGGHKSYQTPPLQQHGQVHSSDNTPASHRRGRFNDQYATPSSESRRPLPESVNTPSPRNYQQSSRSSRYGQYGTPGDGHHPQQPADGYGSGQRHSQPPSQAQPYPSYHRNHGQHQSYPGDQYPASPLDDLPQISPNPRTRTTVAPQPTHSTPPRQQTHPPPVGRERPAEVSHSHSAPEVPTHHSGYDNPDRRDEYDPRYGYPLPSGYHQDYQDRRLVETEHLNRYGHDAPAYEQPHYEHPENTSRPPTSGDPYEMNPPPSIQQYYAHPPVEPLFGSHRPPHDMQPTVEDEDDRPPPVPAHRSTAPAAVPSLDQTKRRSNYAQDIPAPLRIAPSREDLSRDMFQGKAPVGFPRRESYGNAPASNTPRRISASPQPIFGSSSEQPRADPGYADAGPVDPFVPPPNYDYSGPPLAASVPAPDNSYHSSHHQDNRGSIPSYQSKEASPYAPSPYETPPSRQIGPPAGSPNGEGNMPPAPPQHYQSQPLSSYPNQSQSYGYRSGPPETAPLIKPRAVSPVPAVQVAPVPPQQAVPPPQLDSRFGSNDPRMSRPHVRGMPSRKSVSPRPSANASISPHESGRDANAASHEPHLSGVPFSPDSFDAFNPRASLYSSGTNNTLAHPSSVHHQVSSGPHTPDDRRRRLSSSASNSHTTTSAVDTSSPQIDLDENGKIRAADGRVIDPTDHLPVDSWAPEPERKGSSAPNSASRSGAPGPRDRDRERERLTGVRELGSVTGAVGIVKTGAGTNSGDRRKGHGASHSQGFIGTTPAEDYKAPLGPQHMSREAHSAGASPTALVTGRNRLQKRSRPVSSVAASPSPYAVVGGALERERERDSREREVLSARGADARGNVAPAAPSYAHRSSAPGAPGAPPIPAKIPLDESPGGAQEEDLRGLAEEMKRIDIGLGAGSGGRRSRAIMTLGHRRGF